MNINTLDDVRSIRRLYAMALMDWRRTFRVTTFHDWDRPMELRKRLAEAQKHLMTLRSIVRNQAPVSVARLPAYVLEMIRRGRSPMPDRFQSLPCGYGDAWGYARDDERETGRRFAPLAAEAVRQGMARMPGCYDTVSHYEGRYC
jgi:hypothetical protein